MKKLTAFLTAAAMLTAMCGCDDSKETDSEDVSGDVTVSGEEATTEPLFAEFTEDDFAQIDAPLNIVPDKTPENLKCIDLSGIDFGSRLSPCKAPDVCDQYGPRMKVEDEDFQKRIDAERQHAIETPSEGNVWNYAMLGDNIFFAVNYDDLCGDHDSSVFRYNINTGELKELAQRTGLEYHGGFAGLISAHGKLFFYESAGDYKGRINTIDPETGEISLFKELDSSVYWLSESRKGIIVYETSSQFDNHTTEYDADTGDVISEGEGVVTPGHQTAYLCDGEAAEITGGFDGERWQPVTIKTQYYSLSTEFNNYNDIFLWKNKICITTEETGKTFLYTYDLDRNERIKTNFDGFSGSLVRSGDGMLCAVGGTGSLNDNYTVLYYVLPEIGTAYRFARSEGSSNPMINNNNVIMTMQQNTISGVTSNGVTYTGFSNVSRPDKLYFIEE